MNYNVSYRNHHISTWERDILIIIGTIVLLTGEQLVLLTASAYLHPGNHEVPVKVANYNGVSHRNGSTNFGEARAEAHQRADQQVKQANQEIKSLQEHDTKTKAYSQFKQKP